MGYVTKYTGKEIDDALRKAMGIEITENGFIKLSTTEQNPFDLNMLLNPGNYSISFWLNGPSEIKKFMGPINVSVFRLNDAIYQVTNILTVNYIRMYQNNTFTEWSIDQSNTSIYVSPTEPENAREGLIWLKVDSSSLVLKVKSSTGWVDVVPEAMMRKSVYDPQNISSDIYKYIDDTVANANIESISLDFESHVNNEDIHVTVGDKEKWNAAATIEYVDENLATLKETLEAKVDESASRFSGDTLTLTSLVSDYMTQLSNHINNELIHPSAIKIAEWDSKAAGDHTHHLDGKVTIDASAITGIIPIDKIDRAALERLERVSTEADKLKLSIEQVQNGDMVYVIDTLSFYFVVDDTKLGSEEGYQRFSSGIAVLTWDAIENTPTTIAGYGITDAYTKAEVESRLSTVSETIDKLSVAYNNFKELGDLNVADVIEASKKISTIEYSQLIQETEESKALLDQINNGLDDIDKLIMQIDSRC